MMRRFPPPLFDCFFIGFNDIWYVNCPINLITYNYLSLFYLSFVTPWKNKDILLKIQFYILEELLEKLWGDITEP